jgi:hypothetical protein
LDEWRPGNHKKFNPAARAALETLVKLTKAREPVSNSAAEETDVDLNEEERIAQALAESLSMASQSNPEVGGSSTHASRFSHGTASSHSDNVLSKREADKDRGKS